MALTDAHKRAVAKYNAANYERIELRVPKGRKAVIESHASATNESVNGLINRLLREDMNCTESEWKADKQEG